MTARAPRPTTHISPLPPIMRMGCTNVTITYRAGGNETVCLQAPEHGIQQLANFDPAAGDVIGMDDILELTLAHNDLSDVAQYVTSQNINGGMMLYFDPTGHGQTGTAFAFLQGVTTNVAALVANGGMKYIPDAITVTPAFNTPLTLRSGGLETVRLRPVVTGIGPQILNGFDPTIGDKLQLASILNQTLASANLSDIANYLTVTQAGGNTILSVDSTGTGQAGTAFAVLQGVHVSLAQLLANGALLYNPTSTSSAVQGGTPFVFRAAGMENAALNNPHGSVPAAQLSGFSIAAGDTIDVGFILRAASVTANLAAVQNDFATVQNGADTQLWLNPNGIGQGSAKLVGTFTNTSVTLADLLAQSAIGWVAGQGTVSYNGVIMRMGCTNQDISFRPSGNEGVCLLSPQHGIQHLANFSVAAGDFLGLNDILETTQAHANLSDVADYITSQQINGGTMFYVDPAGGGAQGMAFCFLEGVLTNVADLVAAGAMKYVPDQVALAPDFNTPLTIRPDGKETVLLRAPVPGLAAQVVNHFTLGAGDHLELAGVLNKTLAQPNLSDVGQFISVSHSGGNTILSVDSTGHGLAGTAFAVLSGTNFTLSQLLTGNALIYDPTPCLVPAPANTPFVYRGSGAETAVLQNVGPHVAATSLSGFSLAASDGIDVSNILSAANIQADITNISNYFSAVQSGSDTQIWFDPTGSGAGGTLEATLLNSSVSMSDLLSHSALHLG